MDENKNGKISYENDNIDADKIYDSNMHDENSQENTLPTHKKQRQKRSKKSNVIFTVITAFVTVAVCIASVSVINNFVSKQQKPSGGDIQASANGEDIQNDAPPLSSIPQLNINEGYKKEMRGVWIASVGNLNFPSQKGLSEEQLKNELDNILLECADVGFNAIFFQVRPSADSLYKSDIFPWSDVLSGVQGEAPENDFDPLAYILSKASDHGIEIHAWVNPFRVTAGSTTNPKHDVTELSENHPARLNPEYVIPYADGKLYFDPGNPDVRSLIISGIRELCENYPTLAGIHLDDYFYPYPVAGAEDFADNASYEKYGAGLDKANWRRNNVNIFVKEVYDTVKSINADIRFGVSPFGIWANNTSDTPTEGSISNGLEAYSSLYCDALAWVNGGYVDYICPQDYWSFTTTAAPFDNIARWWNAQLDGTGVDLYIGHAAYKASNYTENEIPMQVEFARTLISYKGSVFYGYADIRNNSADVRDGIKQCFENNYEVEIAPTGDGELSVNYPANGSTTQDTSTYILGTSNPAKPLTVNGKKVSRTKDGYFSLYEALANGNNVLKLKSGDENITYTIKKGTSTASSGGSSASNIMDKFEIASATPEKPMWLIPGDIVSVTCIAPAGSKVYAKFGEYTIDMKPTLYAANTISNYKETYKGSIKVDKVHAAQGEMADLGTLTVYAEKNGKKAEKTLCEIKQMGGNVKIYAEVKNDYSYLKRSTTSSFYGDPLPASVGMRDYITAFVGGYYKLKCGYYISENDVEVVSDKELFANKILAVTVTPNIKDSSNNLENSTDIRFGVLENVPVNAYIENGKIKIIFFNTDATVIPEAAVSANPMVTYGKGYADELGRLVYEFTFKALENYYGYNVVYENGFIVIKLHNPQTLKDGDKPLAGKTIVVDAGHGGEDTGAQGPTKAESGFNEADLNLTIALELRTELENRGAKVIMIREDDSTVTLEERIEILSNIIPDMMISVHHNSVASNVNASKARGYLGLYSDDAGVLLANAVSDTVTKELSRYQRPTSYQALAVARNHRFPSTLCEMSFISYTEEFQWTVSEGNFRRSAKALANGVIEFYNRQAKYLNY